MNSNIPIQVKYGTRSETKFKEEVVYDSRLNRDFLLGDSPIIITNIVDTKTNNCLTLAKNVSTRESWNSLPVSIFIGQKNYNTIFTALLSVINQELRIKAIFALLGKEYKMAKVNVSTQTNEENEFETLVNGKKKRHLRGTKRKLNPYVVVEDIRSKWRKEDVPRTISNEANSNDSGFVIKRVIGNAKDFDIDLAALLKEKNNPVDDKTETSTVQDDSDEETVPLGNISIGNISNFNFELAVFNELDSDADNDSIKTENNNKYCLTFADGGFIMLPVVPSDELHLATKETLSGLSQNDAQKLIDYQKYYDCVKCLERDENNCVPIHNAVVNHDTAVVGRHCHILKSLVGTVDIEMDDELTPLHLALQLSNTTSADLLLRHGADVIRSDDSSRCSLHHAVNEDPAAVQLIHSHCKEKAREILSQEPEYWSEELAMKPDQDLALYLGNLLGSMFDNQGYTPLMLAAKEGWNDTVAALLDFAPDSINLRSRSAGETALYLAVTSAYLQAQDNDRKAKISREYINTVKVLVSKGANHNIDNRSGVSLNYILSSVYNYPDLTLIIKSGEKAEMADLPKFKALTNLMLVKNDTGKVQLESLYAPKRNHEAYSNRRVFETNVGVTSKKCKPHEKNSNIDDGKDNDAEENDVEDVMAKDIVKIENEATVSNERDPHKTEAYNKNDVEKHIPIYRFENTIKPNENKNLPTSNPSKLPNNGMVLIPNEKIPKIKILKNQLISKMIKNPVNIATKSQNDRKVVIVGNKTVFYKTKARH